MESKTIIKVQYKKGQNEDGPIFSGREYAYYSNIPVAVGDIVTVVGINGATATKVTEINVPEKEVEAFKDKVKFIIEKVTAEKEPEGKQGGEKIED